MTHYQSPHTDVTDTNCGLFKHGQARPHVDIIKQLMSCQVAGAHDQAGGSTFQSPSVETCCLPMPVFDLASLKSNRHRPELSKTRKINRRLEMQNRHSTTSYCILTVRYLKGRPMATTNPNPKPQTLIGTRLQSSLHLKLLQKYFNLIE